MQNYCGNSKLLSQIYFEQLFFRATLDWKKISLMPQKVAVDTFTRMFQYKVINVLYLNEMCFFLKLLHHYAHFVHKNIKHQFTSSLTA